MEDDKLRQVLQITDDFMINSKVFYQCSGEKFFFSLPLAITVEAMDSLI